MVVALEEGHGTNEILTSLLPRTNIIGMTEIIPRMHDIFIKLVTNKEERK
jgi:hypothetical protein